MRVYLVRHGESLHHIENMTGGWTDSSLTQHGIVQAQELACHLKDLLLTDRAILVSSDLLRAKQTAEEIGHYIDVVPLFYSELRELNNGIAQNMKRDEAKTIQEPATYPLIDWRPYKEAESWWDMIKRIAGFLDNEFNKWDTDSLILVSHSNSMVAIVLWLLGLSNDRVFAGRFMMQFDIASLTIIAMNHYGQRQEVVIEKTNSTVHLSN